MPTLDADSVLDLVVAYDRRKSRQKYTMLVSDYQEHYFLDRVFNSKKVTSSGRGRKHPVMLDESGTASDSGLYDTDTVAQTDTMTSADIPPRFSKVYWIYDDREPAFGGGQDEIFDYVKSKEVAALASLANHCETRGWERPATTSDVKRPWGIRHWITRWPTGTATPGFTGYNPVAADGNAFSDKAGIDATTAANARWRNYAGRYVNISRTDLIRKAKTAMRLTNWKTPSIIQQASLERKGFASSICTNNDVLIELEERAEDQNDNLGKDIASTQDGTIFKRTTIDYVPYLDTDAGDPFYILNWAVIVPWFQRGWYMRRSKPRISAQSHNIVEMWMDLVWNIDVVDPRQCAVLSKTSSTDTTT
jgi:hypothetical protein